jgi:hypothetical protein
MKQLILTTFLAGVIGLGAASQAAAATISLTPTTAACGSPDCLALAGNDSSQNDAQTAIDAYFAANYPGTTIELLYKGTQSGGTEEGPFQSSYNTTYGSASLPDADATISYVSGPVINSTPVFAYIKDGNFTNFNWYLFDITGWNGTDAIEFSGFFGGNQGKISHVSIYGTEASVPDGGTTLALLGLAMCGIASVSRRFRRA